MSKRSIRKRDLQAGIWLVGLGFLFLTDSFWPGILILIGLSILVDALYKPQQQEQTQPDEFNYQPVNKKPEEASRVEATEQQTQPPLQVAQTPPGWHDTSILPPRCPRCGAPVVADHVHWTGAKSADCPYCNGSLIQS